MISDGRFTYTWDAENRLIAMETHATVPLPARRKLVFAYDFMGRRIKKDVWHGTSSGGWQLHHKFDFIHQLGGWNILAERSGGIKDTLLRTYSWGTDLSGNLNGAGGVGGLLFATLSSSGKTFAYGSDLNGNVTLLVDTATSLPAATYDYGPFGELLRQSGEYAILNPYRFSTKYTDDETGWLDYGRRYYVPATGRWPSKDPIGEDGGYNLYGFTGNDGINQWDYLGKDFIAIGRTDWTVFSHAILQYWETPCPLKEGSINNWYTEGELKDRLAITGNTLATLKITKSTELSPYKGKSGNGYTAWANWHAGSNSYLGKRFKNLWISYIKNITNKGKESAPIFDGKRDEVVQKWDKIMASSSSYRWAERSEMTPSKFPQSIYGNPEYSQPLASPIPFNNSNTFARYVLSNASLSSEAMTNHEFPGNHVPRDVFGEWETIKENP